MTVGDVLGRVERDGEFGVWLGGGDGRVAYAHRADETHYAASTMKLAVAIALLRLVDSGDLGLQQTIPVHNDFASVVPGQRFEVPRDEEDGPATFDRLSDMATLDWLATEMITKSANLATNLLLETVGVQAANDVLQEFGGGKSAIRRCLFDQSGIGADIHNLMTAADHAAVLVAVDNDKAVGPDSSAYLRDLLAANVWNDEIPAGLPAGTRIEHKNGWMTRVRHDGGIVRPDDADPFVLSVFTTSDLPDAQAQRLIADIATIAWNQRHNLTDVR